MKWTRRDAIKLGVAAGVAGYAVFRLGEFDSFLRPTAPGGYSFGGLSESRVASVCLQCPAGCGIVVRVVDGRAVKIEGNPKHPVNEGRLCPKGQAGLQTLYDPDRIKGPMKRTGPRGSGEWEPVSWDVAITELADRLRTLREQGKAHTVVSLSGRRAGQMTNVVETFMKAYGSPNHLRRGASCSVAGEKGYWLLDGQDHHRAHDWANAAYTLLFGYPILEASRPLTHNIGAYARMRRGRPARGKLVVVDPRMGTTAGRADEWVPIKNGTDGAMALAMAHVILTEGLWDRDFVGDFLVAGAGFPAGQAVAEADFVENQTLGLVKWWNLVVKDSTPAWQEPITGVPAETVARLAREFATSKPAVTDGGDKGTSSQSNGVYTRACIHALNGLVGAVEAPGGILNQKSFPTKGLTAVQDAVSIEGYAKPRIDKAKSKKWPLGGNVIGHVPTAILDEGYEVNLVLGYYVAPFFSLIDTPRWREAMAKVPYLVSFSPFLDEFTGFCDLVLPDHTYLERYQYQGTAESVGYAVLGLRSPAVPPVFDTMDSADVFIRLAKELGGTIAESFPFDDNRALIDFALSALTPEELDALRRDGAIARPPYTFYDYNGNLNTASRKFEFYSGNLKSTFDGLAMSEADVEALGISAKGDVVYLPHYEPVRYSGGPPSEYPLVLNTYKLTVRGEGRTSNAPHLSEILSPIHNIRYDTWVEINPDTAVRYGISDGQTVWIESTRGQILTRARVYPGCEPGTVSVPHHYGHRGYGRWSKDRGVNPNEIIPQDFDFLCGQSAYLTRVKVYPADGEA